MTLFFLAIVLHQVHDVRQLGVIFDNNATISFACRSELPFSTSPDSSFVRKSFLSSLNFFWCLRWFIVGWISVIVFLQCLLWSLMQQLQSVLNSAARLIFGIRRLDHMHYHLICIGFHTFSTSHTNFVWLTACMVWSLHIYLSDWWVRTSLVPGRSVLRSVARGDIVVSNHRTDRDVWDFLLWLVPAVGMFCQLMWGLPFLVWILLQNIWKHICLERQGTHFWVCIIYIWLIATSVPPT